MSTAFPVVVDSHSKWPEVYEMSTTTMLKTIKKLRFLFASYGLPQQVVTDNGPQFISEKFEVFMKKNGIKHTCSSPYHPSSNRAVEPFNKIFKHSLRANGKDGNTFSLHLSDFLLTYRSTPHAMRNTTPSSLFLHCEVRIRFSLFHPVIFKKVLDKQAEQIAHHDQHTKDRMFEISE